MQRISSPSATIWALYATFLWLGMLASTSVFSKAFSLFTTSTTSLRSSQRPTVLITADLPHHHVRTFPAISEVTRNHPNVVNGLPGGNVVRDPVLTKLLQSSVLLFSAFFGVSCLVKYGMSMASATGEKQQKDTPEDQTYATQHAVLGGLDFIYSQKSGVEDILFKGKVLGVDADVASMGFREKTGARSLAEVDASLYVPERFEQKVMTHIAKHYLLPARHRGLPLILGIWGSKGAGKSFNVELVCKRIGVQVVAVSAGELEDEWAGGVAQRIRERYKVCADMVANEGIPAVLVISDLDAGLGRMKDVQMTVNTQTATGELMAMCDGVWPGGVRVPIIITANDLSRVYAPLLRDGRMDKWYWEPTAYEKAQMLHATIHQDKLTGTALSLDEAHMLVNEFLDQPLDFFTAARARVVDNDVQLWIDAQGGPANVHRILMENYDHRKGAAAWELDSSPVTYPKLRVACQELAIEQQHVLDNNLAQKYFKNWTTEEEATWLAQEAAAAEVQRQTRELETAMAQQSIQASTEDLVQVYGIQEMVAEVVERQEAEIEAEADAAVQEANQPQSPWRVVGPQEAYQLLEEEKYTLFDVRSARTFSQEAITGAKNVPALDTVGLGLQRQEVPRAEFANEIAAAVDAAGGKAVIIASSEADTTAAATVAYEGGCRSVVELKGGYEAWLTVYTLKRKRRQYGNWGNRDRLLYDYWTASN